MFKMYVMVYEMCMYVSFLCSNKMLHTSILLKLHGEASGFGQLPLYMKFMIFFFFLYTDYFVSWGMGNGTIYTYVENSISDNINI